MLSGHNDGEWHILRCASRCPVPHHPADFAQVGEWNCPISCHLAPAKIYATVASLGMMNSRPRTVRMKNVVQDFHVPWRMLRLLRAGNYHGPMYPT